MHFQCRASHLPTCGTKFPKSGRNGGSTAVVSDGGSGQTEIGFSSAGQIQEEASWQRGKIAESIMWFIGGHIVHRNFAVHIWKVPSYRLPSTTGFRVLCGVHCPQGGGRGGESLRATSDPVRCHFLGLWSCR